MYYKFSHDILIKNYNLPMDLIEFDHLNYEVGKSHNHLHYNEFSGGKKYIILR